MAAQLKHLLVRVQLVMVDTEGRETVVDDHDEVQNQRHLVGETERAARAAFAHTVNALFEHGQRGGQ